MQTLILAFLVAIHGRETVPSGMVLSATFVIASPVVFIGTLQTFLQILSKYSSNF